MYINKHNWTESILFWDQELEVSNNIDVFYLLHEYKKERGENLSEHINFMTFLDHDNPEEKFSSSTRRKWRKLNSDIEYKFISSPTDQQVQHVIDEYNKFAKKMDLTLMDGQIYKQMQKDKKLFITVALLNGEFEYFHTFYVSNGISRLFHTFPSSMNSNRDINIGLHRFDLVAFKGYGNKKYDWGGAGFVNEVSEKKLAIREYKRRFGGKEFIYYKARVAGNEKGKQIIKDNYKIL